MKTISPEPMLLKDLVDDVLKGEIVIPNFQRELVWGVKDVKDLVNGTKMSHSLPNRKIFK